MAIKMRNMFYSVKNLRWIATVPLVVLFFVFPLFAWSEARLNFYSPDNLYRIGDYAQALLPIASSIWPIFIFQQYVEGHTRELIFCYRKGHFLELMVYGLSYIVLMAIPFLVLSFYYQGVGWEYLRVAVQSLFFCSFSYAIVFIMRSTTLSLLLTLLLEMLFLLLKDYVASQWSIFSFHSLANGDVLCLDEREKVDKYVILLLFSVLFWGIGYWRAKKIKV